MLALLAMDDTHLYGPIGSQHHEEARQSMWQENLAIELAPQCYLDRAVPRVARRLG